jgi:hypothetical protein
LRGISLIGIDSQNYLCPIESRCGINYLKIGSHNLSDIATEITLNELSEKIDLCSMESWDELL